MNYYIASLFNEPGNDENFKSDNCIEMPGKNIRDNFLYVHETGFLELHKPYMSQEFEKNSFLVLFVVSGNGTFTYHGETTEVSAGACLFADCTYPYSHECKPGSPWVILWVLFGRKTASAYYNYFIHYSPNIFYPADVINITGLLKRILKNTKHKPRFFELINNACLTSLITEIITTPKIKKRHRQVPVSEKLDEIYLYLQENYMHDCSLDNLAKQFYISKYYLSREFKQKFGEGISSFIIKLRIARAKELLSFSSKNINEIAIICGFNDSSHFLKTFKKSENMSPAEYRKNLAIFNR